MLFDIFHSVGTVDWIRTERQVFEELMEQTHAAEELGYTTMWLSESHYSSEPQKQHAEPVIPSYPGEVGFSNDAPQLIQFLLGRTRRIGFGTAIYNIVGGNGGPIRAAEAIRTLAFLNGLRDTPRMLHVGVASGRFEFINRPFGVHPRDAEEKLLWKQYKRFVFLEALEIFLRLSNGEVLSSEMLTPHTLGREHFDSDSEWERARAELARLRAEPLPERLPYRRRWNFEPIRLVPSLLPAMRECQRFVLGSADPLAREIGCKFADLDVFNLSFSSPESLNAIHREMTGRAGAHGSTWDRSRLPRTALIFIDPDQRRAEAAASRAMDVYIEGMRGTLQSPPKEALLARALVGDAQAVREQLAEGGSRGFHRDDRVMLWFEFTRGHEDVLKQMRYFAQEVMPHFAA
jgi:alkanesulfonate monooxygenase SsuD/methylene tetrahydromethanopterin reductase-like flavin-dependent oxidoreductase (luciferase family)